jgi:putative addiction module component (TIGR02574 family)
MSASNSALDISTLSSIEKLDLIGQLWDSLSDSHTDLPMPGWHREELDRRLADADANPQTGKTWSDVEKRLSQRP